MQFKIKPTITPIPGFTDEQLHMFLGNIVVDTLGRQAEHILMAPFAAKVLTGKATSYDAVVIGYDTNTSEVLLEVADPFRTKIVAEDLVLIAELSSVAVNRVKEQYLILPGPLTFLLCVDTKNVEAFHSEYEYIYTLPLCKDQHLLTDQELKNALDWLAKHNMSGYINPVDALGRRGWSADPRELSDKGIAYNSLIIEYCPRWCSVKVLSNVPPSVELTRALVILTGNDVFALTPGFNFREERSAEAYCEQQQHLTSGVAKPLSSQPLRNSTEVFGGSNVPRYRHDW